MMSGRSASLVALAAVAAVAVVVAAACTDIPTSDSAVLSISIDTLPSPAVVLNDTLRDSTGRATAIHATVYNFKGNVISNPTVRFQALDRGVTIDSVNGFVIGDSVRKTKARIAVTAGGLQAIQSLLVTLRPDTVFAVNGRDSLLYALLDSTKNISPALSVRVLHSLTSPDSAVNAYRVSFAVISPTDTLLATLVNDAGLASRVDTTDDSGTASRKIRLTPVRLTALRDSIIVSATVKYRGAQVLGSPVRLVLIVKPASP
ncbi:MAG TPA: hypothetical protein VGJ64_04945 [Gemmatimonadaceae bacterium]